MDGRTARVHSVADLKPFLVPIDTPQKALAYSRILRQFEISGEDVIGAGESLSVEMPGIVAEQFGEVARELGIDPEPTVRQTKSGFEVQRPVVVESAPARVLLVREMIGSDGSYSYEVVKTLAESAQVDRFLWHPR